MKTVLITSLGGLAYAITAWIILALPTFLLGGTP
jgi:hypothetical protein